MYLSKTNFACDHVYFNYNSGFNAQGFTISKTQNDFLYDSFLGPSCC